MLRLESLTPLRKKPSSSIDLWKAFLFALIFHLIFFLSFKVVSTSQKEISCILPFTKVDSEITEVRKNEVSQVSNFFQADDMPAINYNPIDVIGVIIFEQNLEDPDFSSSEKLPYISPFMEKL